MFSEETPIRGYDNLIREGGTEGEGKEILMILGCKQNLIRESTQRRASRKSDDMRVRHNKEETQIVYGELFKNGRKEKLILFINRKSKRRKYTEGKVKEKVLLLSE